jgi:hypothetical protein
MSDYGDDYSDYGDDFFYVEDEYMVADDLAEHAVASPPPASYGEDDDEWDRFDYWNDLEYASDGYDDATFQAQTAKDTQIGQTRKRKRKAGTSDGTKRRKSAGGADSVSRPALLTHSPIVWRAQSDREMAPRFLDDNAQSYALLKNWREKLADTPRWARGSPAESPSARSGGASVSELPSPSADLLDGPELADGEEMDEEEEEEEGMEVSQEALMAALQRQLAAAGGPLSGMDPQQLLQYAMRMATDKDAGDDIAGEMAEAMLDGEDEEDDADTEENLLSWVAQQRNAGKESEASVPKSPETTNRPPTPPSSEANRSIRAPNDAKSKTRSAPSLKRKATDDAEAEGSTKTVKKRATRSFDAPTAASQAKAAAPARATRSTRAKR